MKRRILLLLLLGIILVLSIKLLNKSPQVVAERAEPEPTIVVREVYIHPDPVPPRILDAEPLGEFEITYYTAGPESTGKTPSHPAYGITRSGAYVTEGVTVAVDPNVIPLGTYLYIEGIGFRVAQDTGGAIKGQSIDIYVPDLKTALEGGRHKANVFIIKEAEEIE